MKFFIIILLLGCALTAKVDQVHEVIVIGAGIAGLRASEVLDSQKIEHIVLEASSKVGGRVADIKFAGEIHDKGASIIHKAKAGNPLYDLAQKRKIALVEAAVDYKTIYCDEY